MVNKEQFYTPLHKILEILTIKNHIPIFVLILLNLYQNFH